MGISHSRSNDIQKYRSKVHTYIYIPIPGCGARHTTIEIKRRSILIQSINKQLHQYHRYIIQKPAGKLIQEEYIEGLLILKFKIKKVKFLI